MIWKTDPITFETPNPGRYGVIVNLNDLTCMGALPHSMLVTWLLPKTMSIQELHSHQKEIQKAALEFGSIEIVGGHTEWTGAVKSPILSLTMMGYVPKQFLPNRNLNVGDEVYLLGFLGNEGTSILIAKVLEWLKGHRTNKNRDSTNFEKRKSYLFSKTPKALHKLFEEPVSDELHQFEKLLSIHNDGLMLNKSSNVSLMHDPTEGGLFGALSEIFVDKNDQGIRLDSKSLFKHLHPITKGLCEWLSVDPCRLISSGSLLAIISNHSDSQKHHQHPNKLKFEHEISQIGVITNKVGCFLDDQKLEESQPDQIIDALKNLEEKLNSFDTHFKQDL